MQANALKKVLGYGSAKEGFGHWWMQRVSAVALLPLLAWFTYSVFTLDSDSTLYFAVIDWLSQTRNAILMVLLLLAPCYHSKLGIQVIVEDYVGNRHSKVIILTLQALMHVALAVGGVFAVVSIALRG